MNKIPKIIWQVSHFEYKDIPNDLKEKMNTWKQINKSWQYNYMSFKDANIFIEKYWGLEWKKHFNNTAKPWDKSDILRYLILETFGGLYVDWDSECINPIDSWADLSKDLIICNDIGIEPTAATYCFLAKPNNIFLQTLIKNIENKINTLDSNRKITTQEVGAISFNESFNKTKKLINYKFLDKCFNNNITQVWGHNVRDFGEIKYAKQ
jgi:mannosyltransferase OCH1-like enzyme